jgi:hypothetical protein
MKYCPDCGNRNQASNLFCPICGHCYVPEEKETKKNGVKNGVVAKPAKGRKGRRGLTVAIIVAIVLGLAAGLTSFLVSREIDLSRMITVETGSTWKCTTCGRVYKKRVTKTKVSKKERDNYSVVTIDGQCFYCKYGNMAGQYQDFFEYLSERDFFRGYSVDVRAPAAQFLQAHPTLFPAADESAAISSGAADVDAPGLVADFDELAGRPQKVNGKVIGAQAIQAKDGTKMTLVTMVSPVDAPAGTSQANFMVFYPGTSQLAKDQATVFYLLPMDLIRYHTGDKEEKVVLAVSMYQAPVPASSSAPQ